MYGTSNLANNLMFDIDTFLANINSSQFRFTDSRTIVAEPSSEFSHTDLGSGDVHPESEVDTDELEYIGLPAVYYLGPIVAPRSTDNEGHTGPSPTIWLQPEILISS
jgi:hypothetical protein